eukprot:EG_transcript_8347
MKKKRSEVATAQETVPDVVGPVVKKAKKHKSDKNGTPITASPVVTPAATEERKGKRPAPTADPQPVAKRAKVEEPPGAAAAEKTKKAPKVQSGNEWAEPAVKPPPPTSRAERTLFLTGLPKDKTEEEIKKYYARLAPDAVRKVRNHLKPSCAYVIFKDVPLLEQALALPGPTLRGKLAVAERFDPTKSKPGPAETAAAPTPTKAAKPKKASPEAPKEHKMFVGKCPDSITDTHILEHYASLGEGAVEKVTWIRQGGTFKGYGFVWFRDEAALAAALKLPPPQVEGRTLTIQAAGFTASQFQLFVGGMKGTGKSIVDVQRYFEKKLGPGCITRSRELTEKDGTSRGAGFLDFASEEFMNRALGTPRPIFGKYILTVEKTGKAKAAAPQPKESIKEREAVIKKCPEGMTDEDLLRHYQSLGESAIKQINWTKDRKIAFIVFCSSEMRNKALEMEPPVVDFHVLKVTAGQPHR